MSGLTKHTKYLSGVVIVSALLVLFSSAATLRFGQLHTLNFFAPGDTSKKDATPPPFPVRQNLGDEPQDIKQRSIYLKDPSNIKTDITYDEKTGNYNVSQKYGKQDYRNPTYMTLDEYKTYDMEKNIKSYWRKKMDTEAKEQKEATSLIPKIHVAGEAFDRIFGGNTVDIRPNGSAELILGVNSSKNGNPAIPLRNRRITTFDFNQKIQLNVLGKIGEKLKITTSYNTEATFDFENQMKVEYTGLEDEILQKIELGNVSLPLNSQLITGSQSLFGVKTSMKFGKLSATTVLSQQRGKKTEVDVPPGGGQLSTFIMSADNYEANKHYFLSQYFRDNYDKALAQLPFINSQINITRIEVWVTNRTSSPDNRNVLSMMDLGEDTSRIYAKNYIRSLTAAPYPQNDHNDLYGTLKNKTVLRSFDEVNNYLGKNEFSYLKQGRDYEKIIARKLTPSEFTFNTKLGYISLNQALNTDEVLAVAYQYTLNGETYQVGEFSTDGVEHPKTLFLKMLKGTLTNVRLPMWDLMMKNIYSIGAYQLSKDDFKLDILHTDINTGIDYNFIPEGNIKEKTLLQVLKLDTLNRQLDPQPDGFFDFVEGVTILPDKGRIIFPVTEPFGSYLKNKITNNGNDINAIAIANKFVFQQLYDSTRFQAQQFPKLNRFKLRGSYKSSSGSEISLNALNIPQGAVQVTAGGQILTENIDYTVDYNLGRVKIINEAILNSGKPIKVSVESNSMFSMQQKSMIGTRLDYKMSKDINLGGTFIRVAERPLTQKVGIGDEPISNIVAGLDGSYRTETPVITRLLDKLPFYDTKEMSTIQAQGEIAKLFPGNAKAISKEGISYIDDFEGSQTTIDLKTVSSWSLASTPQGQPDLFPEASLTDSLPYGFNRAKLAWYNVDPVFTYNITTNTPEHIKNDKDAQSNNQVRYIVENELFPNKQFAQGQQMSNLQVLDLGFYPEEKGPYNFDVGPTGISSGIDADGKLLNPSSRWGGIMRRMETTDFEASNVQYIQFWMMDPFNKDNPNQSNSGEFYINLGEVSEDVLRDSKKAFENGLPTSADIKDVDSSAWGRVSTQQSLVNAFDNDPNSRAFQDVGLDGLGNLDEAGFYGQTYVEQILQKYGSNSTAYQNTQNGADVNNDDYHFYLGTDYDQASLPILERYKKYNGLEGNSPVSSGTNSNASSTIPNVEDINRDNTLNENETYYQYRVKIDPNNMVVGKNYITNKVRGQGTKKNGDAIDVDWYQFRIPVREPDKTVGTISDFRSIRFMRMFLKGFEQPIVMRFAKLELVRGEWRKYNFSLEQPGEYITDDKFNNTLFNITAVNLEEHSSRVPVSYVLPPGILRQRQVNSPNMALMNEQSMQYDVCELADGDARAAFKNTEVDMRMYKKLKLFTHIEAAGEQTLQDNDLTAFVRLGSDFNENYYEYEIPLKVTKAGATLPEDVWPTNNDIEIVFDDLYNLKIERDNLKYANQISVNKLYTKKNGVATISIIGTPILSSVRVIMIGVRNPKKKSSADIDDGLTKCAAFWVNEMRLTDFDNIGGWATVGRLQTKLADFGNITGSGGYSTPGFGSVDKKLNERSKETTIQYDLAGQFELGKLIPKKLNLRIPFYVGYGETRVNPRFNPIAPDIQFQKSLDAITDPLVKDSIKHVSQDYTRRRGFNFTNVKKEKGANAKKSHFYDIENWSATYAFNEMFKRNITIESSVIRNYKGGLAYSFNNNAKSIKPFGKMNLGKSEWAKLITDINFSLAPSRLGFKTDLNRDYTETLNRSTTEFVSLVTPLVQKNFTIQRNYDLQWNFTKALSFDFNATNNGRIDEAAGVMHKPDKNAPDRISDSTYQARMDSIITNIKAGGRNTGYQHNANLNWNIPINKIPTFNWVTATVRYSANYQWTAASLAAKDSLGNVIQNSNNKQYNSTLNMNTLYNKWKYYKKISGPKAKPQKTKIKNDDPDYLQTRVDSLKRVLKKPKTKRAERDSIKPVIKQLKHRIDSLRKAHKPPVQWLETIVKAILGTKNVSGSYTEARGTSLPGYMPNTRYMGLNNDASTGSKLAPGIDFISGKQIDIAKRADDNDWLVKSSALNNQYTRTSNKTLSLRATVEPVKNFRIQLTASKTDALNKAEFYRLKRGSIDEFESQSPQVTGNYSVSFNTLRTAFVKDDKKDHSSAVFEQFLKNREVMSARFSGNDINAVVPDSGYSGYGKNAQDIVIASFLSAYSGHDASTYSTDRFPKIPLPNWTVTYDGLSKIDALKSLFKSVTVSHGYKSTFTVSSYTTNLDYKEGSDNPKDIRGNYLSPVVVSSISVAESFSPLFGVDMQWNNSLVTKVEMKKDRNLNMSLSNTQLTEIHGTEYTVGLGYIFKNVTVRFKVAGEKRKITSDLNCRSDVSVRNNITVIRKAYDDSNQPTSGQRTVSLKNSVNYAVNTRLTIRLFLDHVFNSPFVSTSFPTANTNGGLSVRFTLGQ